MTSAPSLLRTLLALTKPTVVVLLQVTALCAVLSHDLLEAGGFSKLDYAASFETIIIVFIGGYLTAGGANSINMWYDRDIDPIMERTANRPIPSGAISANAALIFGISISIIGVIWFNIMTNSVAAFWAAFSILFYVFIYTIWLKRTSTQNIVIGGLAGATPPVIGWAAAVGDLSLSTDSVNSFINSIFDLGSIMPWFLLLVIFLWTPPHFWALALYRSEEYEKVNVPMLPGVKGAKRTLVEMKIYIILLILLSFLAPATMDGINSTDSIYHIYGWTIIAISIWYGSTVFKILPDEEKDSNGRIPSAARSFWVSMIYLALIFVVVVSASAGQFGAVLGAILTVVIIGRNELKARKQINPFQTD